MRTGRFLRAAALALIGAVACAGLGGCLVVSYSTGNGWWVWPGSVIVTLGLMLLWRLSRRH